MTKLKKAKESEQIVFSMGSHGKCEKVFHPCQSKVRKLALKINKTMREGENGI